MSTQRNTLRPLAIAVASMAFAGIAAPTVDAATVNPGLNAAAAISLSETQGAENRRDRRDDRQDVRQDCKEEEGVAGKDKRDCKQEDRQEDRTDGDPGADPDKPE